MAWIEGGKERKCFLEEGEAMLSLYEWKVYKKSKCRAEIPRIADSMKKIAEIWVMCVENWK